MMIQHLTKQLVTTDILVKYHSFVVIFTYLFSTCNFIKRACCRCPHYYAEPVMEVGEVLQGVAFLEKGDNIEPKAKAEMSPRTWCTIDFDLPEALTSKRKFF